MLHRLVDLIYYDISIYQLKNLCLVDLNRPDIFRIPEVQQESDLNKSATSMPVMSLVVSGTVQHIYCLLSMSIHCECDKPTNKSAFCISFCVVYIQPPFLVISGVVCFWVYHITLGMFLSS